MFLNYALKYKKIKKVIWWLSVDIIILVSNLKMKITSL